MRLRRSLSALQTKDLNLSVPKAKLETITLLEVPDLEYLPSDPILRLEEEPTEMEVALGWYTQVNGFRLSSTFHGSG